MDLTNKEKEYFDRIKSKENEKFVVFESFYDVDDNVLYMIDNEDPEHPHISKPMSLEDAKEYFYKKVMDSKSDEYPYDFECNCCDLYQFDYDLYPDDEDGNCPDDPVLRDDEYIRANAHYGCTDFGLLTVMSLDNLTKFKFDNFDPEKFRVNNK